MSSGQWEYRVVKQPVKYTGIASAPIVDDQLLEATLNELGRDGWELQSIQLNTYSGTGYEVLAILKRPLMAPDSNRPAGFRP